MILKELGKYLQDNSLGTLGTNLFLGHMPATPATCACLYENSGMAPQWTFGSTTPQWESPTVQVICRSTDYVTARNKADDIWRYLVNVANQTLLPAAGATGAYYLRVDALQSPFSVGPDENGNVVLSCNYLVRKRLST